jgi:sugar-specific transcriptional regulator TrmB
MNIQKAIEDLGFKRKEAQLYLAALFLGEAKVSDLATKLKIPRTSANVIIEKLHKAGLLNYYTKRFHKYWVAENPEKLLVKLRADASTLEAAMPALKALQPNVVLGKPVGKTYVGEREIRLILDDIILSKKNFQAIIAWNDWLKLFGSEKAADFIELHRSHFLRMRLLVPESSTTRALKECDTGELRETRFLSKCTTSLNTATLIYANKIAIISLNETLPTGFLIEDTDVHNTMEIFFEELWNHCD